MALAFAGSDDIGDWIQNAKAWPGGPRGRYHAGFYEYQKQLSGCVNYYRNKLERWGIQLDYITGHSLGGAAATIYAQEHGMPLAGVATYGAPKTNYHYADIAGWRFTHKDDPVTSKLCFLGCIMSPVHHVIHRPYEYYDELQCWDERASRREKKARKKCKKKWWKFWCWLEYIWTVVYEFVRSCKLAKCMTTKRGIGHDRWFWSIVWGIYGGIGTYTTNCLRGSTSFAVVGPRGNRCGGRFSPFPRGTSSSLFGKRPLVKSILTHFPAETCRIIFLLGLF